LQLPYVVHLPNYPNVVKRFRVNIFGGGHLITPVSGTRIRDSWKKSLDGRVAKKQAKPWQSLSYALTAAALGSDSRAETTHRTLPSTQFPIVYLSFTAANIALRAGNGESKATA
jgi:hypothetical protein